MTDEIALILLPSVLYRSGQLLDIEKLTKAAKKRGIVIGFDLAHSIGAVPHELHNWDVDFAVCAIISTQMVAQGVTAEFLYMKNIWALPLVLACLAGSVRTKINNLT